MSFALLGLLLLAQTSTTATITPDLDREDAIFGDDDDEHGDSREDGIFGGDDEEERTPGEPPADSASSILPDDEPGKRGVLDELEETLGATNDYLDIGGALWLWLEYDAVEEGDPETFRLRSPNFLDLYADARPIDRLRAFVLARLQYDFTVRDGDVDPVTMQPLVRARVLLDQYWVKFDILETLFVTAGQERIRWGVGQIWQPTDFINQQRRDPTALFDLRLGVPVLKLHLPIESLGWNFYANANFDGADEIQKVGGAFRAEFVFGPAELALSAAFRKDQPQQLGADISFGLWLFDIRAAIGISHRVRTPFFRGDPDLSDGVGLEDVQAVEIVDRRDDWIPQVLASADITIAYSDQDTITFGAEYFFNDGGISNPDLYPLALFSGNFDPFYISRHYAAVFVLLTGPGTWDDTNFFLSGIGNLSDRSFLTRLEYQVLFFNYLSVRAFANYHFGENGSLHLGYDVPPSDIDPATIPEGVLPAGVPVEALLNGFEVAAPLFEIGVALTVDL